MAKFIIIIPDLVLDEGGWLICPSSLQDELRFSRHKGAPILVVRRGSDEELNCEALGRLAAFETDSSGQTRVQIDELRLFPGVVPMMEAPAKNLGIAEIPDSVFQRIIGAVVYPLDVREEAANIEDLVPLQRFTTQLARQQNGICGFSGVYTSEGTACIIQPLADGGIWHMQNFLFLDPEPGRLFASFAWTVGPKLEIIIDSRATGPDIADTVSRRGILAIEDGIAATLDRDALAWHRNQFLERIRA